MGSCSVIKKIVKSKIKIRKKKLLRRKIKRVVLIFKKQGWLKSFSGKGF